MTIGERVLDVMKGQGMTQKEFSRLTGIPQSTISEWRRKRTTPSADKLEIICDVLHVEPHFLLSGTETKASSNPEFLRVYQDSEEFDLLFTYRHLDENWKSRVKGYMDAIRQMAELEK